MSNIAPTYLQDIRVDYPSDLDRDEHRIATFGLLMMAMEMTDSPVSIVSEDLKQKAVESQGRNLDIPVMKKGSVTISNVRSCVIAGGNSESALVRVIWKTIASDIFMAPAQYAKNQISYTADLNKKLVEMAEAWQQEIEDDLETALDTNKTTIYNSSIVTTQYALVGDAIQVPESKWKFFFGNIPAINFADNFRSPLVFVVANHTLMPIVDQYANQGGANNTNLAYQFPGKTFRFTNSIPNGPDVYATGYFMPNGTLGFLTRTDIDARERSEATDGTYWFEDRVPGIPFTVGVQYKSKCSDQSLLNDAGLGHLQATKVEHWQFSVDYAILTPYNSDPDTKSGAIRKFEFVADPAV